MTLKALGILMDVLFVDPRWCPELPRLSCALESHEHGHVDSSWGTVKNAVITITYGFVNSTFMKY